MNKPSDTKVTMEYQAVMLAPLPGFPCLGLQLQNGSLRSIDFLEPGCVSFIGEEEGAERTVACLQHYFQDGSCAVEPALLPQGTPFQQRVWSQLRRIPPGQAVSYGQLAKKLTSSARAVANACRANPIPILIPCHRVIAATGLGGYLGETAGNALAVKQWLLHHEGYV